MSWPCDVLAKARIVQKHCIEKAGEAAFTSCPISFVSPDTPPLSPSSVAKQLSQAHRTSERMAANASKRSYAGMQGASGAGRKKRTKYASHISEDNDFATGRSMSRGSAIGGIAIEERIVDNHFRVGDISDTSALAIDVYPFSAGEIPSPPIANDGASYTTFIDDADAQPMGSDIATFSHDDGMAILDGYFLDGPLAEESADLPSLDRLLGLDDDHVSLIRSPVTTQPDNSRSVQVTDQPPDNRAALSACLRGTTSLIRPKESPNASEPTINTRNVSILTCQVKRSVLDESGHLLEDVFQALEKANDIGRIPDSFVPGMTEHLLGHGEPSSADYSKIMTSIAQKCVKCNRSISRSALDAEQERLRDHEKSELDRMAQERLQMNTSLRARCAIELNHQQYAKHLKIIIQNSIAQLDVRDLVEKQWQDTMSEPAELTGEFKQECEYEKVIKQIEQEHASDTRNRQRSLWKESYYWPMIQQRAKMIGPLPNPSGPKTAIIPQEKIAAKQLVVALGYGTSRDNIFKWTSYWKLVSDLREQGGNNLLLYRTQEFKTHFFRYPKQLDILRAWNDVLDFPLRQLRLRVIAEEDGDFSGKCDVEEARISERLRAVRLGAWNNSLSAWSEDKAEYETFTAHHKTVATSGKSNQYVLCHGIRGKRDDNQSVFVSLVPYEGKSGKRVMSNKAASTKMLAVSTLAVVMPGDFLGLFSGQLRYVDQRPAKAIKGPFPGFWLDYSETPGKLNQMRVAKAGEATNVCVAWEGVNEFKGEKSFCQYWRVLVIATRKIAPFDELIRSS